MTQQTNPQPSEELKEGYLKAIFDYAPKTNSKKFREWCSKYDFDYIASGRRAWCSSLQTYFRGATGVAFIDGEMTLFYEEDIVDIKALINQEVQKALSMVDVPEKWEQNIYRDTSDNLMCKECGDEVFGGICGCIDINKTIEQVTTSINKIKEQYKTKA